MRWCAGWNMSGYLPEVEPVTFDEYGDAVDYVLDELERWPDDEVFDWDDYLAVVSTIEEQRVSGSEVHALIDDATRAEFHVWVVPVLVDEEA